MKIVALGLTVMLLIACLVILGFVLIIRGLIKYKIGNVLVGAIILMLLCWFFSLMMNI